MNVTHKWGWFLDLFHQPGQCIVAVSVLPLNRWCADVHASGSRWAGKGSRELASVVAVDLHSASFCSEDAALSLCTFAVNYLFDLLRYLRADARQVTVGLDLNFC